MTKPPDASVPPKPPLSLRELRERARSPEAEKTDIDALLGELLQPVRPGENRAERAELLSLILEDPWLGGFTGTDGRRVDRTAAHALAALGEPHASRLSAQQREELLHTLAETVSEDDEASEGEEAEEAEGPEAEQEPDEPEEEAPAEGGLSWRHLVALICILGTMYECFVLGPGLRSSAQPLLMPFSLGTVGLPSLMFLFKPEPKTRALYRVSSFFAAFGFMLMVPVGAFVYSEARYGSNPILMVLEIIALRLLVTSSLLIASPPNPSARALRKKRSRRALRG